MNTKHCVSFFKLLLPLLLFVLAAPLAGQGNCALSAGELVSPNGTAYVPVCLDDGNEGPTEIIRTDFVGGTSQYFLTNPAGFIIEVLAGNPPFDFTGLGSGIFAVWSVSYSGTLQGATVGENICAAGATQCFSLSNPIVVNRARGDKCVDFCTADGGMLALTDGGTETTVCIDDGAASAVAVSPDGQASGANTTFLITNDQGEILAIPSGAGPFDLSPAGAGTCLIWYLAYDDNLTGLETGNTPIDFTGCYALSNPVTVNRLSGDDCVNQLSTAFVAELSGLNEVPCPVTSTGNGAVTATLDGNTLTVSGTFSGLTSDFDPNVAGGAHLHLGSAGMGGPVALLLSSSLDGDLRGGSFPAADNVFELTNDQVAILRNRGLYVNIHTVDYGPGELRGQLLPAGADDYKSAVLLGVNENPSVMTSAMGAVVVERRGNSITVSGSFSGLAGEIATDILGGAHIHQAIAGRNGPVLFPLTLVANDDDTGATIAASDNSFELTDDQVDALNMDMLYVNVHSQSFRSGELRGQISDMSTASFYANLAGHQSRPVAINTPGNGRVMLNFDGASTLTVSGSVSDLMDTVSTDIAGGAHLHLALAGATGPVVFPMTITLDEGGQGGRWLPADNTFTLTPEQVEAFYNRGYYVNVHSGAVQSGEVRGQVMNLAKGYFGSNLAGVNANPAAQKTTGGGFIMYELCGNDLTVTGSFADLASDFNANIAGGSHIHAGDAASTGGIVASLNVDVADDLRSGQYLAADNTFTLSDEGLFALITGGYYFNLHTTGAPSGEIRGQLLRDDDAFPAASEIISPEDGARVTVFPDGSDLMDGSFTAAEDPNGDLVVYTIEIASVDNPDFSTLLACEKVGTRTTSDASIDAVYDTLIARGAFPGIEVPLIYRIVSSDGSVSTTGPSRNITLVIGGDTPGEDGDFTANLSGLSEVPCPVTSTGGGSVTASLVGNTLTVSGSFAGLTSDFDPNVAGGAHLHLGVAGQGGPVALLLTSSLDDDLRGGTFPAEDNVFTLTPDQAATLRARGVYVNIHTVDYGSGELRGQLVPAGADDYKSAVLLGVNESPSVMTSAMGGVVVERTGNTITVSGSFSSLSGTIATDIAGGVHIHQAIAGRNGPVLFPLALTAGDDNTSATIAAADNTFELTDDQLTALDMDMLYVNVHSEAFRSGELRGQISDMSTASFYANLAGHQSRPMAINTPGNGRVMLNFDGESTLTVSGSVSDLMDTVSTAIAGGAHLHLALAGATGPVAFPMTITLDEGGQGGRWLPADNTFTLTPEQVAAFYGRGYYVNVHSGAVQSGEVRGQVMNLAKGYFGSNLAGINANPAAQKTTGGGFVMYELCGNDLTVTGSFANLATDFDANVAGGSHIHVGDAASTGGIVASLNADVADDLRSGQYLAADNSFELSDDGVAALLAGGYYFNLHTTGSSSGEIRGQLLRDDDAFPAVSEIISPEDGARVTVSAGSSDLEDGSFTAVADPNGDLVVYTVEIASVDNPDFSSLLACEKVGTRTTSDASIDAVYDTLIAMGAFPGIEIPLIYRIVSSDGSVSSRGASRNITLIIGDDMECEANGGTLALEGGGDAITICAGDGESDVFNVVLTDTVGTNFTYVITDGDGKILGLPIDQPFDLEGAGGGACLIWALSYEDGLLGLEIDSLASNLMGCFDLSNPITVTRLTGADCGGNLSGTFVAMLSGLNEVPTPVTSTGSGMLTGVLDGTTLTVSGSFSGLTADFDESIAGGAHLHAGLAGQGGGVAFRLNSDLDADLRGGTFSADSNVFELTLEQAQLLNARGIYVNIHTMDYASGELRGQMVPSGADDYKMANLLGVNENPSVVTPAVGAVVVERTGNTITVSGSFSGLMDTVATDIAGGAHIHQAIAGRNGPVVFPLSLDIADDGLSAVMTAADNVFELTDEQAAALDMDMFYVNVHSAAVRSGELRGQIKDQSVTSFYANLAGHQARPMPVNTPGNGRLLLNFDGVSKLTVSGSVNDLMDTVATAIAGGAHIHLGLAGSSGPVVFPLTITSEDGEQGGVWLPADNSFDLTPEQVTAFYDRQYYVNVHSGSELSGEVRGQVMNLAKGYYGANLSPTNAFPQPTQSLLGDGFVIIEASGNQLTLTGSFANIRSDFDANIAGGSHLHLGDNNSAGGIAFGLNAVVDAGLRFGSYSAMDNQFAATDDQMEALANGGIYFNLHTTDEPSGSVRGQLLRDDNAFPTAPEINSPDDGTVVTLSSSGTDTQDASISESVDPDGDQVVYVLEVTAQSEPDFEEILAAVRVGTDTMYSSAFGGLYDSLIARGFTAGISVPILYRFKAIDGSVASAGAAQSATVVIAAESPGLLAINEVDRDGTVELINLNNVPVDFGQLYLGGNGDFRLISDLQVVCGNLITKPGDQVTVGFRESMGASNGELALTIFNGYSTTAELLSYVAWGEGERNGEVLASVAGLWTIGTELAAPGSATSVQLINSPTERVYALGAPTPCADNTLSVGADSPEAADKVSVYPNPFTQQLTLEVTGLRGNETNVQFLDINGRLIAEQQLEIRDGRFSFDAATLASGTYLIRLTNEGGSSTLRVVKR